MRTGACTLGPRARYPALVSLTCIQFIIWPTHGFCPRVCRASPSNLCMPTLRLHSRLRGWARLRLSGPHPSVRCTRQCTLPGGHSRVASDSTWSRSPGSMAYCTPTEFGHLSVAKPARNCPVATGHPATLCRVSGSVRWHTAPQQSLTTSCGQTCPLTSVYNEAHQRVSVPGHRPQQQSNCWFNRPSPLRPCAATGSAPQQNPHQLPAACPTGRQLR